MTGGRPEDHGLGREDLEAVIEARRDLGPTYEPAIVESLAEKVEQAIDARADARIAQDRRHRSNETQRQNHQLTLGIVSLGTGIPITAIAAGTADLPGLVVAWVGIAAVNAAHALSGRPRR
jgi:hypothetical protein